MFAFGMYEIIALVLYALVFPAIFKWLWNTFMTKYFGMKEIGILGAILIMIVLWVPLTLLLSIFT